MSEDRFGDEKKLMLGVITKEAVYGTVETPVDNSVYQTFTGYNLTPEGDYGVATNDEEVHGSEFSTLQEITENKIKLPIEIPMASPNDLVIAGLGMGAIASAQDAAVIAYRHNCTMVARGTALPSVSGVLDPANRQVRYSGIKPNSWEIGCEAEGHWKLSSELMTSGTEADSSDTILAVPVQKLLRAEDTEIYIKTAPTPASDWIAVANLAQDTDNISAAQSLVSIGDRVKSWKVGFSNNLNDIRGHGGVDASGAGASQDLQFSKRAIDVELVLRYADATERDYFKNQTLFSLEFNCRRFSSGVIADTGAFYYGAIVRLSQVQLKEKPIPQGGVSDPYEITLVGTVMDDGTNTPMDLTFYNAIDEYLK